MAGTTNRAAGIGAIAALALAGAVAGWWFPHSAPETRGPNVLFIVWDTTRADRMSLYGNPRPTTPRLVEYAKDAVVYEQARATDMWTMPSHAAMFTGLPTSSHGVNTDWRWLDSHYLTLPEHFAAAGWDTYGFTANQFASQNCNLFQGMSAYDTVWQGEFAKASRNATREKRIARDRSTEISPGWKPDPSVPNMMWSRGMAKDAAPVAHEALIQWVTGRKDPEKPWFAFINMMEAHWPRVPSMAAREQVLDPAVLEKGFETDATLFTALSYNLRRHDYTDEEVAAQVGVYDAALVDLDSATGALLDDLKARGVLDDTIVVITADHGEYLGDHHMFDHRYGLYDSMTHVPLVVRYPGKAAARRVPGPVTTAGIWTEVVRLAGLEIPADGWRRATLAENGAVVSEYPLYDNRALDRFVKHYGDLDLTPWKRTLDAVVDGSWKLISYHDHLDAELYDLASDPGETHNLAAEQPARVSELQGQIDSWKRDVKPYEAGLRTSDDHPKSYTPSERQQLEALGYLVGDEGADEEESDAPIPKAKGQKGKRQP